MNLRTITNALFEFDAHYPRTIIATIILITVLFGWKVPGLEMDPGLRSGLPRDHKIVQSMEIVDELFSGLNKNNEPVVSKFENSYNYKGIILEKNMVMI